MNCPSDHSRLIWRGLSTPWEQESFSSSRVTRFSASQTNNLRRLCRIRGGVSRDGSRKSEVVELCRRGVCAGRGGDGVSDAIRPCKMKAGQAVLIHGAAGNVGAYAVQLAKQAELRVFAPLGLLISTSSRPRGRNGCELQDCKVRRCRAPRRCGTRHGRRRDAASFIPRFKAGRYPRVVGFATATAAGFRSGSSGRRHKRRAGNLARARTKADPVSGQRGCRGTTGWRGNAGRCAAQERKNRTYDVWRSLDTALDEKPRLAW